MANVPSLVMEQQVVLYCYSVGLGCLVYYLHSGSQLLDVAAATSRGEGNGSWVQYMMLLRTTVVWKAGD